MTATDEPPASLQDRPEPRFPADGLVRHVGPGGCGQWTIVGLTCGACGNRLYLPRRLLKAAGGKA